MLHEAARPVSEVGHASMCGGRQEPLSIGGDPCFAGEARHQMESYKRAFVIAGAPDENWFHKSFPRVQKADLGAVEKRGAVLQERDVPAQAFLDEIERRGIKIEYRVQ
jgi:hypothetical protein